MLAPTLPPPGSEFPHNPQHRRGGPVVWRAHTEGFATIAYRDGRAIAGISGPWSSQYVLIWWQPEQPIREVEVLDSLHDAKRAVAARSSRPASSHVDVLLEKLRREYARSKPTWIEWLGAALRRGGKPARQPGSPLPIHRTRSYWRNEETDLRGLHFRAVR